MTPTSPSTAGTPADSSSWGNRSTKALASVRRLRGRETHHPDELSNAQYGLLFSLAGVPDVRP